MMDWLAHVLLHTWGTPYRYNSYWHLVRCNNCERKVWL